MKQSFRTRVLALLLALVLTLTLAPAALAADPMGGTDTTPPTSQTDPDPDQSADPVPPAPDEVTEIRLNQTSLALAPGSKVQLTATLTPATTSATVTWKSENESLATVSANGEVTAGMSSAGRTRIIAQAGSRTASCVVEVQGIVLKKEHLDVKIGESGPLEYEVFGLPGATVSWRSDDNAIVSMDASGSNYYIANDEGKARITATVSGTTYSDSCEIQVRPNTAAVIRAQASAGAPLSFASLIGELNSRSHELLGAPLSYLTSVSVSTREGTLYYQHQSEGDTGAGVGTTELFYTNPATAQKGIREISFVPKGDFHGTATIQYTGYSAATKFFSGAIEVSVAEPKGLSYTVTGGEALQLQGEDFAQYYRNQTNRSLNYVVFSLPDSSRGKLYYNYISESYPGTEVRRDDAYRYGGTPNLSDVYFVPAAGYSGTVTVAFTAHDASGQSARGRMEIQVLGNGGSGDIRYQVSQGGTVGFDDDDFEDLCRDLTGNSLRRVRFDTLPAASQGTLYYDYRSGGGNTAVSADRDYYVSSAPYLRRITFAANEHYTGTADFDFTGWDSRGNSFSGTVEITVKQGGDGDIRYQVSRNGTVTMKDQDFNDLCRDLTGSTLSHVRFQLPPSSQGTLYHRYGTSESTRVSAGRNYYRSSEPRLDQVTFEAASGSGGTVEITFTGWSVSDESFTGTILIDLDRSGASEDVIRYTVRQNRSVDFEDASFNALCRDLTGESLSWVRFEETPSSAEGTLCYQYREDSGRYDKLVTTGKSYYRSSDPRIDRISFVANGSRTGVVELAFTGCSSGSEQFRGVVEITVESSDTAISYSSSGGTVLLRTQDFLDLCREEGLKKAETVQFTPPAASAGHLYYRYTAPLKYGAEVRSGTSYRLDSGSPSVSDLTFVPKAEYRGTVTIPFTAYDAKGKTCGGTVRISVQPAAYSSYFSDMGSHSWAAAAVNYLYENGVVKGSGNGLYHPGSKITRGQFMIMLSRAFQFSSASTPGFSDVPANSYYAEAIAAAKERGIASGYANGAFRPDAPISRQDATVFLQRALRSAGWSISGSESTLSAYPDGAQVGSHARGAMAAMVERGILRGNAAGRLNPYGSLTRAEMAVILYRALTM